MGRLFTIGYEASALDDVLGALKARGVTLLVDVRAIAGSRRKGFSKTALSEALADEGIGYLHLRGLGDPKAGREAARSGYMREFERIYHSHLKTEEAKQAFDQLIELTDEETICLLCYELDAQDCHRRIVAAGVAGATQLTVEHLKPASHDDVGARENTHHHQGGAAPLH